MLTLSHLIITIDYMRIIMDADCLIKLVKSNLKEVVCENFSVVIPATVKEEVIDQAHEHPDAQIIRENLERRLLILHKDSSSHKKGEDAVYALFREGKYDAVCSDDKKFIKRLRLFEIPYITPAVFVAILFNDGKLGRDEAFDKLTALSPFISDDEYQTIRRVLQQGRKP